MSKLSKLWQTLKIRKSLKKQLSSKTNQAISMSTAGSVGLVTTTMAALRAWQPMLPWTREQDALIVTVISTVVIPLISRAIAKWREPEKFDLDKDTESLLGPRI